MNIVSERPGVYSSYDASSVVLSASGGKTVGLAALCQTGEAGTAYDLSRYETAVTTFGEEEAITGLIRLLFLNGAARVWAVPVADEEGYEAAFEALNGVEDISIVVCDSGDLTVQQSLRDSVAAASEARRERIAVVAGDAGESDPAVPLGGAVLKGVTALSQRYEDGEIDTLVQGGVTPLEAVAGQVSVVRGVTTRTKTGEVQDSTWRELTTIRVVDDVIPAVRSALRAKFARAKNTEQSRGAIRSQVIVELENKLAKEIITGYENVTVEADSENPTVCLVEFSFTVAHGLNQIWLSAHITV